MYPIQDVTEIDMVFGADAMKLMPAYADIPDEIRKGGTVWNKLFADWFDAGLESLELKPKEGVDKELALRHIKTIIGSFEPEHEHKEAGVAFLFSEWFEEEGSLWTAKKFAL